MYAVGAFIYFHQVPSGLLLQSSSTNELSTVLSFFFLFFFFFQRKKQLQELDEKISNLETKLEEVKADVTAIKKGKEVSFRMSSYICNLMTDQA